VTARAEWNASEVPLTDDNRHRQNAPTAMTESDDCVLFTPSAAAAWSSTARPQSAPLAGRSREPPAAFSPRRESIEETWGASALPNSGEESAALRSAMQQDSAALRSALRHSDRRPPSLSNRICHEAAVDTRRKSKGLKPEAVPSASDPPNERIDTIIFGRGFQPPLTAHAATHVVPLPGDKDGRGLSLGIKHAGNDKNKENRRHGLHSSRGRVCSRSDFGVSEQPQRRQRKKKRRAHSSQNRKRKERPRHAVMTAAAMVIQKFYRSAVLRRMGARLREIAQASRGFPFC
jgi:hypothetical protein